MYHYSVLTTSIHSLANYISSRFGGNVSHDPHILYTLSALQILAIYGSLAIVDKGLIKKYVGR